MSPQVEILAPVAPQPLAKAPTPTTEAELPLAVPLTDAQRALVKATVPVLQENGATITRKFYKTMLEEHTELQDTFSHSKQMQGKQAQALAGSVLAYAQNIDDPSRILSVVERIAHKHVSMNIQPVQYAIVGHYLLKAITDVVGADVFTGALYDAWYAAYWQLAHIFIKREAELYGAAGWAGWRPFRLVRRERESEDVVSFYFVPKDGAHEARWSPGQYISIRRWVEELQHYQIRQYSLSDSPSPHHMRISVRRDSGGENAHPGYISNLLHDSFTDGETVEIAFPFGDFFLNSPASLSGPVVFISAGIGCTPLIAMLNAIIDHRKQDGHKSPHRISWIHGAHDGAHHPFKSHLAALGDVHKTVYYSRPRSGEDVRGRDYDVEGRIDFARDKSTLPLFLDDPTAQYFVCGPHEFMTAVLRELKKSGVAPERAHAEVFGSGGVQE